MFSTEPDRPITMNSVSSPLGDIHELLYDHGGAVVEVGGFREVEDDDLVILDVRADHPDQLIGGGHGETPPEHHQTDPRRVQVRLDSVFLFGEKGLVQHRHGDHAVEFQAFQLPRVGHARGNQPYRHGGYQIDEHRKAQRDQHDQKMFALDAVDAGEQTPVNDVPADLHQDAGENSVRNRLDVWPKAQH